MGRMIKDMDNMNTRTAAQLSSITGYTIDSAGKRQSTWHSRIHRPRILDTYGLVYVYEGYGEYESGGVTQEVGPGSCILLFPGVAHTYGALKGGYWKEFWILFSGPRIDSFAASGYLDPSEPIVSLPLAGRQDFSRLFELVVDSCRLPATTQSHRLYGVFWELLLRLLEPVEAVDPTLRSMRRVLEDHLGVDDLKKVITTAGYDYDSFRMKFYRSTGLSPGTYVRQRRLQQAKELLLHTDLPVGQIGYRIGYQDPLYFSRVFSDNEGISPSRYRKERRG